MSKYKYNASVLRDFKNYPSIQEIVDKTIKSPDSVAILNVSNKEEYEKLLFSNFCSYVKSPIKENLYEFLSDCFDDSVVVGFNDRLIENKNLLFFDLKEVSVELDANSETNNDSTIKNDTEINIKPLLELKEEKIDGGISVVEEASTEEDSFPLTFSTLDVLLYCEHLRPGIVKNYINIESAGEKLNEEIKKELNTVFTRIEYIIGIYSDSGESEAVVDYLKDVEKNAIWDSVYSSLLKIDARYADVPLIDILNYLKNNFSIIYENCSKVPVKDNSFILNNPTLLKSALNQVKKVFSEDINTILKKDGKYNVSEYCLNSLRNRYNEYIDTILIIHTSISFGKINDVFFPKDTKGFIKKSWFLQSSLLRLEKPNNENKEYVKSVVGKFKEKRNIHLQLIGDKRKDLSKLREMFPNFMPVTNFIDNYLSIQEKSTGVFYFPPILLDGPPGIGKTFYLTMLADIFSVDNHVENMASVSTGSRFTGTEQHWNSCDMGIILELALKWKYANSLILLDEIDKVRETNHNGVSPLLTLLPVLERKTAIEFKDVSINIPVDVSHMIWTASSNNLDKLHPAIISRFNIFKITAPTENERKVLTQAIYTQLLKDNQWNLYFNAELPQETLNKMVAIDGGSARDTKRLIHGAMAKAANENSTIILPHHLDDDNFHKVRRIGF